MEGESYIWNVIVDDCGIGNIFNHFLFVFMEEWLTLFGVTESTYVYAKRYFEIMALGCVAQGVTLVLCDFIRIGGKIREEILILALGAVSNIVLVLDICC